MNTEVLHRYSTSVFTYFLKQRGQKSQQALQNAGNGRFGSLEQELVLSTSFKLEERAQGHLTFPTLPSLLPTSLSSHHLLHSLSTAALALPVGTVLLSMAQHHPGRPLSHSPVASTQVHILSLSLFQPPTPASHLFQAAIWVSSSLLAQGRPFHEPLKHPQSPSPGSPEPYYKQECLSAVKLGMGSWLCPKGHLHSTGRKSNAQHSGSQEPPPTGDKHSRMFLNSST